MSTPTMEELIDKATPGPWVDNGNEIVSSRDTKTGIAGAISDADSEFIARCNPATMAKAVAELEWIAAHGWNPHGTTIENAHLAYDCHCVAAQLLNLLNGKPTQ